MGLPLRAAGPRPGLRAASEPGLLSRPCRLVFSSEKPLPAWPAPLDSCPQAATVVPSRLGREASSGPTGDPAPACFPRGRVCDGLISPRTSSLGFPDCAAARSHEHLNQTRGCHRRLTFSEP